jgi:flagellar protein FliO/FliZ
MKIQSLTHAFAALSAACLAVALLATAPPALAANGEQTKLDLSTAPSQAAQSSSSGGGLVRTIVGLAVVIGVIYGLSWVLKQVKSSKEERHSGSGLAPLATLPLGPNRSLHLVQAGEEVVLLGTGERGVTPIRTYSAEEARELGLIVPVTASGADDEPTPFDAGRSGLVATLRKRTVIK